MKIKIATFGLMQGIVVGGILLAMAGAASAAQVSIGTNGGLTLNLNRNVLAALHGQPLDQPFIYLEDFFNQVESATRKGQSLIDDHPTPGTDEISATGLKFGINGSTVINLDTRRNLQTTDFMYDPADPAATATGQVGLGGVMRYRLGLVDGALLMGDLELTHANRGDASGWLISANTFLPEALPLYDTKNVTVDTTNGLVLSGDLMLTQEFLDFFEHGPVTESVGTFEFAANPVPVPAAVWLFGTGMVGLVGISRRKKSVPM